MFLPRPLLVSKIDAGKNLPWFLSPSSKFSVGAAVAARDLLRNSPRRARRSRLCSGVWRAAWCFDRQEFHELDPRTIRIGKVELKLPIHSQDLRILVGRGFPPSLFQILFEIGDADDAWREMIGAA